MAIAFDVGSQIGSDGTGTISGTLVASASAAGAFAFVHTNASVADEISTMTYGGVAMTRICTAFDTVGEPGRVDAYFLGRGALPTGSQTVELTVSAASSKRLYCGTVTCGAGLVVDIFREGFQNASIPYASLNEIYGYGTVNESQANPQVDFVIPATRTVYSMASVFSGGSAAALTPIAGNTQIAESAWSSAQTSAFSRLDSPINNATLSMGWTAISDDVAMAAVAIEELTPISGNIKLSGSNVPGSFVSVIAMDSAGVNPFLFDTATADGSGNWSSYYPVGAKWIEVPYYTSGGNFYTDSPYSSL